MRSFPLVARLALACAFLTVASCGGRPATTITLTVSPKRVTIGDGSSANVTITGSFDGATTLLDESTIELETDVGNFEDAGQATIAVYQGGSARAKLVPPSRPAKGTVTARYIDPYGVTATASAEVEFVTTSSVTRLHFSCSAMSVGAFITGEDMAVRCDATPEDAEGQPVRNATVRFLTEAGGFDALPEEEGSTRKLFAYNPKKDGRKPKDVAPFGDDGSGEPRWVDPSPEAGRATNIRNPRDGLVTLIAYVEVENDDGLSTPYVDANDNERYDAGEDMPPGINEFEDEQRRYLWKMIKILWTTEGWSIPGITGFTGAGGGAVQTNIPRPGTLTLNARIVDRNLNPLSANGPENTISFDTEGPVLPSVSLGASGSTFRRDQWGIDITTDYRIRNKESAGSYMIGTDYTISIKNINEEENEPVPPATTGTPKAVNYTVTIIVTHQAGTDDTGAPSNEMEMTYQPIDGKAL